MLLINYLINMLYENYRAALKRLNAPFNKYTLWRKTAKILKLSPGALRRLEWFIYYKTKAKNNARLVSRHFGIAPKTFYKWKKFFNPANLRLLEDKDKAPTHIRTWPVSPEQQQRAIKLK